MSRYALIAAAVPAILGSFLLMHFSAAPRALLLQQAVVAIAAIVATLVFAREAHERPARPTGPWPLLGLAALVCAPLILDHGPTRPSVLDVGIRRPLRVMSLPDFYSEVIGLTAFRQAGDGPAANGVPMLVME